MLLGNASLQFLLLYGIALKRHLPALFSFGTGIQLTNFPNALLYCRSVNGLDVRRLHLLAQQLLVNQAVKSRLPISGSELAQRTTVDEGFMANRLLPAALQDGV